MSRRIRFSGLVLALALAAGCEVGPTAPVDQDAELATTLDAMAAEANRSGDADAAAGYSGGALAIRAGAEPSEIVVSVGGELVRYLAVVTAAAHQLRDNEIVLRRTLIAWTGRPRPEAILQVTTMADEAQFAWPAVAPRISEPARALGIWADLVARQRWAATSGSAAIELATQAGPCPRQPLELPLRCILATFDLRIDGEFHQVSAGRSVDHEVGLAIATTATGVNGVVIARVNP